MQKKLSILLLLLFTLHSFGQKTEVEELINQIAEKEIPENFDYYFLVPQSIEQPHIYDTLQNFQIRELRMENKDFPIELIYEQSDKRTNWKKYDFKDARYVPEEYIYNTSPPTTTKVEFVRYNINQSDYDKLIVNKKPHLLIVKKKWFWNKNRIFKNEKFRNELFKAREIDAERKKEEKIYFGFSIPIFSKDGKYAKISINRQKRCKGNGFTALYKKQNGTWEKLMEFNPLKFESVSTHINCEELILSYK
tara:strand:- start:62 stop:811 length:750 start_codon:yes stop_codon:yes gene_type:complete